MSNPTIEHKELIRQLSDLRDQVQAAILQIEAGLLVPNSHPHYRVSGGQYQIGDWLVTPRRETPLTNSV